MTAAGVAIIGLLSALAACQNPTAPTSPTASRSPDATGASTTVSEGVATVPVPPAQPGIAPPDFSTFAKWSDPATWGGTVPAAGAVVTVAAGRRILVDVDVPKLGGLEVDGDLAFADRPTTLRTAYIMVHGSFWMGTEGAPLTSAIRLILDGRPTDNTMGMGADVLGSMGGRIEIHGRDSGHTWTKLSQTANAGATTLSLIDPVSWRTGDLIVVASSDLDVNHKERVTVAGVSADGRTITIDRPLAHRHASIVTAQTSGGETRSVEERAEVGLLSHNIVITGPDNAAATKFGGHVMIMKDGTLRMSNTELDHMGQFGVLARYPIHWHWAGDQSASLVDNVSIIDSFNRMVTIHRSNNVHVNGVVADETYGAGFFLEDRVEEGNVLTNNLVMGVRQVPAGTRPLRASDQIPSEFWITDPNNILSGNSAAGGDGVGIWYDFDMNAVDPGNASDDAIHDAVDKPFGLNQNSTAHSHTIHPADFPAEGVPGSGISVEAYNGDFTRRGRMINPNVWKNEGFGLWIDGALTTDNPTAANNSIALNCQDTAINNGLLIGNNTANTGTETGHIQALIRFYHGQCDTNGTWLANFKQAAGADPGLAAISDIGASTWDATNRVKGLKFFGDGYRTLFASNSPYFEAAESGHSHWFADLDGSVKGDGVPAIIHNDSALLRSPTDRTIYSRVGPDYFQGADFGTWSPLDRGFMRLRFGLVDDHWTWKRADGVTGYSGTVGVVEGQRYQVTPPSGGTLSSLDFDIHGTDPGFVDLVIPWAGRSAPRAGFKFWGQDVPVKMASSVATVGKDGQYFVSGGNLYLRIEVGGTGVTFGNGGDLRSLSNADQYWTIR
ncbi:G8 domain-containing protein [Frankia sp. Cj5]|uniref:G8 domain-containing protein n=1 Tax=Frankia sp. Cj5 TaxID=2880978 RepID=UPI001EF5D693|nr:G8 domain-containing protein [Frankia sp. Cj5]